MTSRSTVLSTDSFEPMHSQQIHWTRKPRLISTRRTYLPTRLFIRLSLLVQWSGLSFEPVRRRLSRFQRRDSTVGWIPFERVDRDTRVALSIMFPRIGLNSSIGTIVAVIVSDGGVALFLGIVSEEQLRVRGPLSKTRLIQVGNGSKILAVTALLDENKEYYPRWCGNICR